MVHTFNPNTQKAEAGGSMSLRAAWSREEIPEQPSLGSEENHQKQKAGEDVSILSTFSF